MLADADCDSTRRARVKDVAALGRFLGLADPSRALGLVVAGTPGQANAVALGFKADQLSRKLAPNTINRRLSTLRRAVRVARRLGLVDWSLDVELLRSESYRDTDGRGLEGWRALLAAAERVAAGGSPMALRDLANRPDAPRPGVAFDRGAASRPGRRRPREPPAGRRRQGQAGTDVAHGEPVSSNALAGWIGERGSARGALIIRTDRGRRARRRG